MSCRSYPGLRAVLSLGLVIVVSACSGGGSSTPTGVAGGSVAQADAVSPAVASTSPSSSAGGSAGPSTGHVGDTLSFSELGGDKVEATLVKVIDPATPTDASDAAPPGTRFVGLGTTIVDHSPDIAGQDYEIDGFGSDGHRLTPDKVFQNSTHVMKTFAGCTPPSDGLMDQQPGQPWTSCDALLVPTGVTLASVGLRVGGAEIDQATATDQATWAVP